MQYVRLRSWYRAHLAISPARDGGLIPNGGAADVVVSPGPPTHGTRRNSGVGVRHNIRICSKSYNFHEIILFSKFVHCNCQGVKESWSEALLARRT